MKHFKTKAGTEIPLLDLRGKDYLVVAQRVRWFREEHPTWAIKTAVTYNLQEKWAIGHATILDDSGKEIATAHKYEDAKGFGDFIEKSETGAIGRALALAGYGTQFAPEFDEGERLADSPVERKMGLPGPEVTQRAQWTQEEKRAYCVERWNTDQGRNLTPDQIATLATITSTKTFSQAFDEVVKAKGKK